MIAKFINDIKPESKILLVLVAIFISVIVNYFNGFNFGIDLADSHRFILKNDASGEVLDTIVEDFQIKEVQSTKNSQDTIEHLIYVDEQDAQIEKIRKRLEEENKIEFVESSISPEGILNLRSFFVYIGIIITLFIGSIYLLCNKNTRYYQNILLTLSNIANFFVVVFFSITFISLLSFIGWPITKLTLSMIALSFILVLLIQVYFLYEIIHKQQDQKITSLSKLYLDYFEKNIDRYIKYLVIITCLIIPFTLTKFLNLEICLILITMWLAYLITFVYLPASLKIGEVFFVDLKKKN